MRYRINELCGACERHIAEHGPGCMFLLTIEPEPIPVVAWAWSPGFTSEEVSAMVETIRASGFVSPIKVSP